MPGGWGGRGPPGTARLTRPDPDPEGIPPAAATPGALVRAELRGRGTAVFACDTTAPAAEAEWRHLCGRVATEALARAMSAVVLAAGFLRADERLSLQIKTEGKLGGLLVDVGAEGDIRGYTHRKVLGLMDAGPSDSLYAVGSRGTLTVMRYTETDVRYSGNVELDRGDMAGDIERYLTVSEQRDSIVEIHTEYAAQLVYSGGMLVQAQPGADSAFFAETRKRRAHLLTALVTEREPERAIRAFFPAEGVDVVERRPIAFRCNCSRERVLRMIAALDKAEIRDMVEKDRSATITCHFCSNQYLIEEPELRGLLRCPRGPSR